MLFFASRANSVSDVVLSRRRGGSHIGAWNLSKKMKHTRFDVFLTENLDTPPPFFVGHEVANEKQDSKILL